MSRRCIVTCNFHKRSLLTVAIKESAKFDLRFDVVVLESVFTAQHHPHSL